MEKKTEVITVRITAETKRRLTEMAKEKEWSLAQTANKILTGYLDARYGDLSSETQQTDR